MKTVLQDAPDVQPQHRTGGRQPGPTDEIDLLAYGRTVWRYRYLLVLVVSIVGAATYAINRATPPTYEVTFRLMVMQPRITDEPFPELNIVPFREMVESPMLVAELLDEFGLRGEPNRVTPQAFLAGHVDVDLIPDSPIIRVAVRLRDRDLLLKVAERYAQRVVELAQRLSTEGADHAIARIKIERDAALQRLTASEESLDGYRRETQIELIRNDVDTMLLRRPEALDLIVDIGGERARVQQIEAELARQDRIRDVRRAVDSLGPSLPPTERRRASPEREQQPRSATQREQSTTPPDTKRQDSEGKPSADSSQKTKPEIGQRSGKPVGILDKPVEVPREDLRIRSELLDPYVNPVHEALERDLATARGRLASLEERRRELVGRLRFDAPGAQKLNRLYEAETGLAKLTREQEVAQEAYLAAATKYEEARLQNAMRAPRLQILDAALPPDRAVAPRALRNTLAAVLIALTLAMIAVIVYDASPRRTA